MIKLLLLFLTLSVTNAQTLPYLLPDEKSIFEYELMNYLKKAHTHIVLLTPSLNHPALRRQLIQSVSKGVKLTLITQNSSNDPLQLVAYNGVDLYLYRARPLNDTVILIDERVVCHVSGGLSGEELSRNSQIALCNDERDFIDAMHQNTNRILTRSKLYLK
ncbi:MAG: phospholipase D-like domain-containing protein [Pseudomonadota bacterium]